MDGTVLNLTLLGVDHRPELISAGSDTAESNSAKWVNIAKSTVLLSLLKKVLA
jgi:hypothetical protein